LFFQAADGIRDDLVTGVQTCALPILGIQAIASIPVAADSQGAGEDGIGVNFAGVSFFDDDFIYADSTGIVLSAEELELEIVEI